MRSKGVEKIPLRGFQSRPEFLTRVNTRQSWMVLDMKKNLCVVIQLNIEQLQGRKIHHTTDIFQSAFIQKPSSHFLSFQQGLGRHKYSFISPIININSPRTIFWKRNFFLKKFSKTSSLELLHSQSTKYIKISTSSGFFKIMQFWNCRQNISKS